MARKVSVGGSAVRTWANSEAGKAELASAGLSVGERGRFSAPVLELFHKHNPGQRYAAGHVEPVKVSGVRVSASGRKVPVTVKAAPAELRAFAKANGGGERGRISAEVKAAFAAQPKV